MIEFPITLTSGGSVCLPGRAYALALGYTKNRGVYRLAVTASGEWEGLTIRAFWHVPDGKDPVSSLVVDGYVDVPASVTAQPGSGCITFEGSDGAKVTGKNLLDFLHDKIIKTGWNGKFTRDKEILTISAVNGWNAYWFVSPVPGEQISLSLTYRQINDKTASTGSAFVIGTSDTTAYPSGPSYLFETQNPSKTWATAGGTKISKQYINLVVKNLEDAIASMT